MAKKSIPKEIQEQAKTTVDQFNNDQLGGGQIKYSARFQKDFLYLDRVNHGQTEKICRLKYTGRFDKWEFAIFKYSSEKYSPDEFFFPGADKVDGTIEGAMAAGMEAHPF